MEHRLTVLWTQYFLSLFIFAVVTAIVTFGIWTSYMHFRSGNEDPSRVTTIKIGHYGVEISTTVTGIVILLISLFFFYLFVARVFPVTEVVASG